MRVLHNSLSDSDMLLITRGIFEIRIRLAMGEPFKDGNYAEIVVLETKIAPCRMALRQFYRDMGDRCHSRYWLALHENDARHQLNWGIRAL